MTERGTPPIWGEGVEISPPKLYELVFGFDGTGVPELAGRTQYKLTLNRLKPLELGVQFGVSVVNVPGLTLRATYRMIVSLREGSPEARDPERAFRGVATRIAPVAMYPFIREALLSAAQRALLPPIILPIMNVGLLWDPKEIKVPEVDSGAEQMSEGD